MRRRWGCGRQIRNEHVAEHVHGEAHTGISVGCRNRCRAPFQASPETHACSGVHCTLVDVLLDVGRKLDRRMTGKNK